MYIQVHVHCSRVKVKHNEVIHVHTCTCLYDHFPRDTAGQERFRTLTNAYFRGAAVSQFTVHCMICIHILICVYKHVHVHISTVHTCTCTCISETESTIVFFCVEMFIFFRCGLMYNVHVYYSTVYTNIKHLDKCLYGLRCHVQCIYTCTCNC